MRLSVASFLLALGFAFPALLNGQTFSNGLVGLACAATAVGLVLNDGQGHGTSHRFARRVVVVLGSLLAVLLVAQLPSAYRFQVKFNQKRQELRLKRKAGRVGTSVPPVRRRSAGLESGYGGSLIGEPPAPRMTTHPMDNRSTSRSHEPVGGRVV
jgi:hypothetical protein